MKKKPVIMDLDDLVQICGYYSDGPEDYHYGALCKHRSHDDKFKAEDGKMYGSCIHCSCPVASNISLDDEEDIAEVKQWMMDWGHKEDVNPIGHFGVETDLMRVWNPKFLRKIRKEGWVE